jgi:thiamine monophosphate synthase
MVVTDRRQARVPLPEVVTAAVAGGARWVLLREKDLPRAERFALARRLRAVLARAGGTLVVAGPDPLGGYAVHLSATDPPPAEVASIMESPPRPAGDPPRELRDHAERWIIGRSCHHPAELARLTIEDYLTVSPVFPSASKPGYGPALGLAGLAGLAGLGQLAGRRAVLALGGVDTPDRVAACLAAGAAGVAVMGAVMRAPDPAAVVAGLVGAAAGRLPEGVGG